MIGCFQWHKDTKMKSNHNIQTKYFMELCFKLNPPYKKKRKDKTA